MSLPELIGPLTIIVPIVLALPASFVVVRALRPSELQWLIQLDERLAGRLSLLVWLTLSGLFIMALRQLMQVLSGAYVLLMRGLPFLVPDISPVPAAALTYQYVIEPLVWLVLLLLLLRQLRNTGRETIQSATGWRPNVWQSGLLALTMAGLMMWPMQLPATIGSLANWIFGGDVSEIGLEWLAVSWPRLVALLGGVLAYVFGAIVAWRLMRAVSRNTEQGAAGGRILSIGIWLVLTAVLSVGIEHLLVIVVGLIALGNDVLEGMLRGIADVASRAQLVNLALPILAYPLAADAVGAVDWDDLGRRLGGRRLRVVRFLLLLTVASWMSWLFQLPEWLPGLVSESLVVRPELVVMGSGAAVVLLWIGYFVYFRDRAR